VVNVLLLPYKKSSSSLMVMHNSVH